MEGAKGMRLGKDGEIHQSYSKHFNENYQLSKKLIEKLVERTIVNSFDEKYSSSPSIQIQFPPPAIREERDRRHRELPHIVTNDQREGREYKIKQFSKEIETDNEVVTGNGEEKVKKDTIPSNFLESSSELFIQTPPHLNLEVSSQSTSSPIFYGGELLPEYSQIKSKVQHSKGYLDLSNQNFGNHHIVAVTEALTACEMEGELRGLSLRGNRLTDHGICEILRKLQTLPPQNLISLDLSDNKIGRSGALTLGHYLRALHSLQKLNLSNIGLGDGNAGVLFQSWSNSGTKDNRMNSSSLISLRIAKNKIERIGARELAIFLKNVGSRIAELDISWNELRAQGAALLWDTLTEHSALTSLDVSWNSLGNWYTKPDTENLSVIRKQKPKGNNSNDKLGLGRLLSSNKSLLHLNISQNKFSYDECNLIGQALRENNTLLGIHVTGNCCRIDSHGLMTSDNTPWPLQSAHISEEIVRDPIMNSKFKSQPSSNDTNYLRNCCWICETWQEVEFTYQLTEKDISVMNDFLRIGEKTDGANLAAKEREKLSTIFPVHIFTSFDNWQPERMLLLKPHEIVNPFLHQTPKRTNQTESQSLSPTKPSTPPPSNRRLVTQQSRKIGENFRSPPVDSSIGNQYQREYLGTEQKSDFGPKGVGNKTPQYTFEFDDLSEYMKTESFSTLNDRNQYFKELLQSFESGHRKMLDLNSEENEIEEKEDPLISLCSKNVIESKLTKPTSELVSLDLNAQRPVYRLRRMVPPGRHAYVFAVGRTAISLESQPSFIFYDPDQPCNVTSSVVSPETSKLFSKNFEELSSIQEVLQQYYPLIVDIFTYFGSIYSGDVAVGLGGMAYNEIILQYHILDPIQDFLKDKRTPKLDPSISTSIEISHPSPSTRATMLLKEIHIRAKTPPTFLLQHGLDAIDSNVDVEIFDHNSEEEEDEDEDQEDESPNIHTSDIGAIDRIEVDMVFISNCTTGPRVRGNHKRTLTRFQFLDAVVSLACLKYIQSRICFDVADAIEKFCVDIFGQFLEKENDSKFLPILVSKEIDSILRRNWNTIEKIFKNHASGSDLMPINSRLLSLPTWLQILPTSGIRIGERPLRLLFGQSKSKFLNDVLDEQYDPKNLYLSEFAEALTRCSHYIIKESLEVANGLYHQTLASQLEVTINQLQRISGKG